MPGQLICCGKEITLQREGVRVDVADQHRIARGFHEIIRKKKVSGFEIVRDVIHSFAFTHGEGNLIHVTFSELPENVAAAYCMIEKVFSRFERTFRMAPRVNLEG